MIANIPGELQNINSWVVSGSNKVPINPRTGEAADPTNSATWGTFAEVLNCGYPNVGFVLSRNDPFTVIDLDNPFRRKKDKTIIAENDPDYAGACACRDRQEKILAAFESYTEFSQSGEGLHIIVKGKIPQGVRRDNVEIYPFDRYIICTGNRYNDLPIANRQELLDRSYLEMQPAPRAELVQVDGHSNDERILEIAFAAANGAKFKDLWEGRWEQYNHSQSEADFSLMSMLCHYSKDNEQCARLFWASGLGQRKKAHNKGYVSGMLSKQRAKEVPVIDFSAILTQKPRVNGHDNPPGGIAEHDLPTNGSSERFEKPKTEFKFPPLPGAATRGTNPGFTPAKNNFPPGFIGECAEYFLATVNRPVPEIALAAAIALTAGVIGRSFNISNSGLNQYLIVLARTGRGKEGAAKGIDNLLAAVRPMVPMADQFRGPALFASGQALIRTLDKKSCFFSIIGEIGLLLEEICSKRTSGANQALKRILLDLYAKSGFTTLMQGTAYSDSEKNTSVVQAPCLTILGESTPESFFESIDISHIASGLVPRFIVINYDGPRPPDNEKAGCPPPGELVNKLAELLNIALTMEQKRSFRAISTQPDAHAALKAYGAAIDVKINGDAGVLESELWSRAHFKVTKLAGLIAASVNPNNPVVTIEHAAWSIDFIDRETGAMVDKFSSGDIGEGEARKESDIRRVISSWFQSASEAKRHHKAPESLINTPFIPLNFITRRCLMLASFKKNSRESQEIEQLIKRMIKTEILIEMPIIQAFDKFGVRQPIYAKGPNW